MSSPGADVKRMFCRAFARGWPPMPSRWDLLSLDLLRKELHPALAARGVFALSADRFESSHRMPLHSHGRIVRRVYPGAAFLERFALPKKQRKLFDEQQVTHRYATDEESRYKGLEDLFLLHAKRSAELRHQTSFISPRVKAFHHEVSRLVSGTAKIHRPAAVVRPGIRRSARITGRHLQSARLFFPERLRPGLEQNGA